jgi:hypothetical protein
VLKTIALAVAFMVGLTVVTVATSSSSTAIAAAAFVLGSLFFIRTVKQVLELFTFLPDLAELPDGFRRTALLVAAVSVSLVGPWLALVLSLSVAHGSYAYGHDAYLEPWLGGMREATYGFFGRPNQFDAPDAAAPALVQAVFMWLYTAVLAGTFAGVAASTIYQRSSAAKAASAPAAPPLEVRVEVSRWPRRKPKVYGTSVSAEAEADATQS